MSILFTFVPVQIISLQIRGYHCDAYGHVNNARYLELLEEARWKFLEPAIQNSSFDFNKLLFVVVQIDISFKKPLVPNQWIDIDISHLEFKNSSISMVQEIRDKNTKEICTQATITFVLLDATSHKPVSISNDIKEKFENLIQQ